MTNEKKMVMAMVRRVRKLYESNGFSCEKNQHAPKSNSVYFVVRTESGDFATEIRVSDHYHPIADHKGYNFVIVDMDICEDLISDIEWEISE